MKTILKLEFLFLLFIPVFSFSQKTYIKSFKVTFCNASSFNNGFSGYKPSDVSLAQNCTKEALDVTVNKVTSQSSALVWNPSSCHSPSLVFDQTNRYIEFRVQCDFAQLKPMNVGPWDTCTICCTEKKTWSENSFTIPQADKWYIIFLTIPPTTGGSQNLIDTLSNGLAWRLENGSYSFSYFKMGTAAIPPQPVIDSVPSKKIYSNETLNITLTGISIPGRLIDGLTIKAETKTNNVIKTLNFMDSGNGSLNADQNGVATATLQVTPDSGAAGLSDSIIITLKDTIRNTTTKTAFEVSVIDAVGLADMNDLIKVYPTPTEGLITVEFPVMFSGDINVINMSGNRILSQKIKNAATTLLDLSQIPSGSFLINISDGQNNISKKVIKK